ncbi:unnamed protein product [Schistocephalus solidus]|uniref:GTP-binding protein Di-Ras2 n=1 Tax=Schistocephalus solidus TaxID=70667 RepID=A0A183T1T7_SCHSO|nr:unnamed protein product [Schistocephalus solidus]
MPEQPNDYRVAVFGSSGVGKSSLVMRFVKGTFKEAYVPTIEDTFRQVISCNRQVCTLQITDTTGSHQFPAMQRLSMSKGHAFVLVYSVNNRASLEDLTAIYQELASIKGTEIKVIPIMLVGNKMDEEGDREISTAQGEALAKRWQCGFMETSAKANVNVKEVFQELLRMETRQNMTLVGDISESSSLFSCFRCCSRTANAKQKSANGPKRPNAQV